MKKRTLIQIGNGYKIYLTKEGKRVTVYSNSSNIKKLATKVVNKCKKHRKRGQIKQEFREKIKNYFDYS